MLKQWVIEYSIKLVITKFLKYIYILFIQTYCVKNIYIMINTLKKIFF